MSYSLIMLAYALLGVVGGMILTQTIFKGALGLEPELRRNLFLALLSVTTFFFLSPTAFIFLMLSAAALFYFSKKVDPILLGVFLLPLIPAESIKFLTLPGINYLIPLSFPMLLALFLFTPVAMGSRSGVRPSSYKSITQLFLVMIIGFILLDYRTDTITHSLRLTLVMVLTYIIPLLAITRTIDTREKFDDLFRVLVVALVIMAAVALVSQQFWWDVYADRQGRLFGGDISMKARGGLLRVSATYGIAYINVGILLVMGGLFSIALVPRAKSFLAKYGLPSMLFFGALMTASRSPFIAGLLSMPVLLSSFPNVFGKLFRTAIVGTLAIGMISITPLGATIAEFMPSFDGEDQESYRSRLMDVGMGEVRKRPVFGDSAYRQNPNFEVLRQGEGIIDFVNSYLEKALHFGIPLTLLYLFISVGLPLLVWRQARRIDQTDRDWRYLGGALSAGLLCFAGGLFGTATNGQTEIVGYVLAAMALCYLRITDAAVPSPGASLKQRGHTRSHPLEGTL